MPFKKPAPVKMPTRFDALLLSITERCHVGCAHCGFIGAKRHREASLDEIADWTKQAAEYGIGRIIFTGGEPFLRTKAMRVAIDAARPFGPVISTFTSSFWGRSVEEARNILESLEGLDQLYLSSDAFHQERIPYDYVHNVIQAALDLSIPLITICITYSNDEELNDVRKNYVRWGEKVTIHQDRVIPTQFLSEKVMHRQAPGISVRPEHYARTCYLQTPLLNPNGDFLACHTGKAGAHRDMRQSPYFLGNMREETFEEIVARISARWSYQYLRTQGPRGVAQLANDTPAILEEAGRTEFTTACDMCFSVLKTQSGRQALLEVAERDDVRQQINIRLALGLGEQPLLG